MNLAMKRHGFSGVRYSSKGYRAIKVAQGKGWSGYRFEHVLIAERALGCPLPKGAEVHHVDRDSSNNSAGNLVICEDREYHKLLHVRQRVVDAGGDPNGNKICSSCKTIKPSIEFHKNASRNDGLQAVCKECRGS